MMLISNKPPKHFLPIGSKITLGSQADVEGCHVYSFSAFLYTCAQNAYKTTKFLPMGESGFFNASHTLAPQVPQLRENP